LRHPNPNKKLNLWFQMGLEITYTVEITDLNAKRIDLFN
jgi:hypothetical protein